MNRLRYWLGIHLIYVGVCALPPGGIRTSIAAALGAWAEWAQAVVSRACDSGSGPQGENSRSEVEGEAPQSGVSESERIAQKQCLSPTKGEG